MILASQSPRRRELLEAAGFELTVVPASIDETRRAGEKPVALVERLACEKAAAVADRLGSVSDGEPVVAADTIVWTDDGAVLGKPADVADAARMLRALSGRAHHVSTGVCLVAPTGARRSFVETTDVTFWELTDAQMEAYVASGEPADKAGAYGIQGAGRMLVRGIRGDYENVVGLPVARLVRELSELLGAGGDDLVARSIRMGGPLA
ncbi:Maf family protein [Thermophilibacter sp.]